MSIPQYPKPDFDPPPAVNPNDTGPWSNRGLTLHRTLRHMGLSMKKCNEYIQGIGRVHGDYVVYPFSAMTIAQIESSVETEMIMLYPTDIYKKDQIADEWSKKPKAKNGKTAERGWSNNIVPFAKHLCERRPSEVDGGLENSFVIESIRDKDSYVFINQLTCEAGGEEKGQTRVAHRPVSIGTFTMRRDTEKHKEGTDRSLMTTIQTDHKAHTDFPFHYEDGKTLVVEIKLLCGHNDFRGGGGHMIRKFLEFAAEFCTEGETSFICALDATRNAATTRFYNGMGFVSDSFVEVGNYFENGSLNYIEKLNRFVRVVKLNPDKAGTLL